VSTVLVRALGGMSLWVYEAKNGLPADQYVHHWTFETLPIQKVLARSKLISFHLP